MVEVKQALGYSVNFHGHCVPKNALYFREGSTVYYCDDFSQFSGSDCFVTLYKLDLRSDYGFRRYKALRRDPEARLFLREIKARSLRAVKCERVLCLNRAGALPRERVQNFRQERMRPEACGQVTDRSVEKEPGSFVAAGIEGNYNYIPRGQVSDEWRRPAYNEHTLKREKGHKYAIA